MLQAASFTDVTFTDEFWQPRLAVSRTVTIPVCLDKCESTGRIDNFARAGGLAEGPHVGRRYDDSDVFKVIEGAAYALAAAPDPELRARVQSVIEKIAAAQEPDGYLYTARTIDPANPADGAGPRRWSYLAHSHELYNVGHLYEAAVAWHQATGDRTLLDVAVRNADLIDREFGPGRRTDAPGHEEIEIGLVKLWRATGDDRYLELAEFFLDRRGRPEGRDGYGTYAQDHAPVTEQSEPVGHAVRAMYLYTAMADAAAATGDRTYVAALDRIWRSMVETRLYLTGGVGARQHGEAFGDAYELPNESAYNETCAAIGNALWNHRMALLHRDARYADVLERVLYNGLLAGVSLEGDTFFYPNPLASGGSYHRSPWFSCSCCPVNVARFVPSVAGMVYAHDAGALYVNLFVQGTATIDLAGGPVVIEQATRYPWDGRIAIAVRPQRPMAFALNVRIPGWAKSEPLPGGLYSYADARPGGFRLSINGTPVAGPDIRAGYARLERTWAPGDRVTLELAMAPRLVWCDERVEANRGRVAIVRGPIVYCLEAADNNGRVSNLWIPRDAELMVHRAEQPGGGEMRVVAGTGFALQTGGDAPPVVIRAIPYYAWDHREAGEMIVWIPTRRSLARIPPEPTIASGSRATASHCWEGDTVEALHDRREPASSADHSIPRMTWWDHLGTTEWVQYDFDQPQWVSRASVYWFDDTGAGRCRVPASWRLLYRRGETWAPVPAASGYGVERDAWNAVEFDPVHTTALRLEVTLQAGFSGGLLEWRIE